MQTLASAVQACPEAEMAGRVRQIIRLSNLPAEIVAHLKSLQGAKSLKRFSENKLIKIVVMKPEDRLEHFEKDFGVEIRTQLVPLGSMPMVEALSAPSC